MTHETTFTIYLWGDGSVTMAFGADGDEALAVVDEFGDGTRAVASATITTPMPFAFDTDELAAESFWDVLEEHAPEWAKMFDRQPATAGGKK